MVLTRPNGKKETVSVVVQAGEGAYAQLGNTLERVEITGTSTKSFDVKSTESTQVLSKAQLDRIPVARNVTAITPAGSRRNGGDSRIGQTTSRAGNVPSLGGASPAENTYYINGFNVTNIVNGWHSIRSPTKASLNNR